MSDVKDIGDTIVFQQIIKIMGLVGLNSIFLPE